MSSGAQSGSRDYTRADFSNAPSGDLSSSLAHLSREQRERLTEVLDQYLSALEKKERAGSLQDRSKHASLLDLDESSTIA